ncbi:Major cardiolipin synthase ClsA [compost metagenome]
MRTPAEHPLARAALLLCLSAVALTGCGLPTLENRTTSTALAPAEAALTTLGQGVATPVAAQPGKSGIYPLNNPLDAFAARALLAQSAERSLDVQYYIWRGDMTGTLLLEALHDAADRGVRVRLLLDDNGTAGLDAVLASLDSHPNIEVRLFNPFVVRSPKLLGFVTDFSRVNRRMHNKSFTADNSATIVGGRNVGDEYFGATDGVLFSDLDVLAIGQVVGEVSSDFDRYWNGASSYPLERILPGKTVLPLAQLHADATRVERDPAAAAYVQALQQLPFITQLVQGKLPLEWAPTRIVSDDPLKALGKAPAEAMIGQQLKELLGEPRENLELVSPYFVPTASGTEAFAEMTRRGVKVRILTNALEATDVEVVHSGYAKRRLDLLRAGVQLFEMRGEAGEPPLPPSAGPFGSSGSSLHAKTFAVDHARVFVGSFNFDPRSANLNTELGFVIDSETLARQIDTAFDTVIPQSAYEVRLSPEGKVYWLEQRDGKTFRYNTEPGSSVWQRAWLRLLAHLPIESML